MKRLNLQLIRFIHNNQEQIIVLIAIYSVMNFFSSLPYLNLFFTPWTTILFEGIVATLLFGKRVPFIFAFILLGFSLYATVFSFYSSAVDAGVFIYIFLTLGFLIQVVGYLRSLPHRSK